MSELYSSILQVNGALFVFLSIKRSKSVKIAFQKTSFV